MPLPKFTKESSHSDLSRIGSGEIGEKAAGLLLLQSMAGELPSSDDARVYVPNAVVLTSEVFQNFIEHNELATTIEAAEHNKSPSFDSEILRLFLESEFPSDDAIQLRDLLTLFKSPIAVRPSSVLATRLEYPFSGVYGSKLLSNTSTDEDARVIALQQAIKAVYATVFYFNAGEYLRSIGEYHARDEKLAIIIQELAGRRFGDLYHPCVSGVARSFNYYVTGHALPEDGMADIALGLGRTILDGENVWTYCPRYPKSPPPVATIDAMLDAGQTRYWSLRIDDDSSEEDLVELAVGTADKNLLAQLVSTYDADSDRLVHGLSKRGAQLLDFSPLLQLEISSFNDVLRSALDAAANLAGHAVELEVSVTWDPHDPRSMEFALIQVNSMRINREEVSISDVDFSSEDILVSTKLAMGNGVREDIEHILYLRPDAFDPGKTRAIAEEVSQLNRTLVESGQKYVLIGFGRWGSSEPWLGVPVRWSDISGAQTIVEATSPKITPDLSQGSHFFRNLISFDVFYFSVRHGEDVPIDWEWLNDLSAVEETQYARIVRAPMPLRVKVDGQRRRGAIWKRESTSSGMWPSIGAAGGRLIASLQERAKELNCLYEVEDILGQTLESPLPETLRKVIAVLPWGLQYPEICVVLIRVEGEIYALGQWEPTEWHLDVGIRANGELVGQIEIYYLEERALEDMGPFLKEERRLLDTVADRLGHFLWFRRLHDLRQRKDSTKIAGKEGWRDALMLLRRTDRALYGRAARKMLHHMWRLGVEDAKDLLSLPPRGERDERGEVNELQKRTWFDESVLVSERPFEVAAEHMGSEKILQLVGQWIEEDRVGSLIKVVDSPRSSVQDIKAALRLFRHHGIEDDTLRDTTRDGLRTSLIRRLLSDDSRYIEAARKHLSLVDFDALLERLILPPGSYGKLGGKASGLFLAQRIIEQSGIGRRLEAWGTVTAPKTFFLATDAQMHLVQYNEFQGILEQVYRDIDEVRDQHSNIEQMFRSAVFPPDIINSLSMVLDEMGNAPLIVRSSSLLEDSYGMAFSGKYESLFLSNQGSKRERLAELLDGISEVYASVFGPDAIAYRRERGLMCVIEEMGILIQEVVGRRIGDYFLPAFSGVAFTNNEFRWSPRIERRDGLIRLVPGLGTRAVDRVADDYPVLIVPSRPEMKANAKVKDTVRYAPRKIDVLNLKSRHFETLDLADFVEEKGDEIPWIGHVFSIFKEGTLRPASPLLCDPRRDTLVATFEGLINRTAFVKTIRSILDVLENALDTPVDIEFACDGERVYLLQCRPQSNSDNSGPAVIPRDISTERLIFSANRFVSNGHVAPISHIVYVVPEEYRLLGSREEMLEVGKAVGELNKILPKRQFVLMGPGRWGSRGDITLGVPVTYADICNVSVLIEIARRQGGYVPDLSFGTHFFQDLVESNIRYLPLYPDEEENAFNEIFLASSENIFAELVPAYSHLDKVIKVIDVPASSDGSVLRVLCNAELDMAVGMLALPEDTEFDEADSRMMPNIQRTDDRHWQWRMRNVSKLAKVLDYERFGVVAVYVFGSTKNASAGPGSDIDLLFHVRNKPGQQRELEHWIDGWSHALGEANYLRTGYEVGPLIDAHYVCDEDFECKDSYATKIGAVTDAARLVPREDDSK